MRLVFAMGAIALLGLRIWDFSSLTDDSANFKVLLYFVTWVLAVSAGYFTLAFLLTFYAVNADGLESPSAPFLVWFTWILHATLVPAVVVNALLWPLISEGHDASTYELDIIQTYVTFVMVFFDAWVNRQPYYAAFHGLIGLVFCYSYLVFNIVYIALGGTDAYGNNYIYAALPNDYSSLSKIFSSGRVAMYEIFLIFPILNVLYWCMLWARRRARVAQAASKLASP